VPRADAALNVQKSGAPVGHPLPCSGALSTGVWRGAAAVVVGPGGAGFTYLDVAVDRSTGLFCAAGEDAGQDLPNPASRELKLASLRERVPRYLGVSMPTQLLVATSYGEGADTIGTGG
jgi:hypothetical protein